MTPPRFRIGACLSLFPPVVGGAELLLFELARRWVRDGHPTTVFTRTQPGAPAEEWMEGIRVLRSIHPREWGPCFGATFVRTLARSLARHAGEFDVLLAFQVPWESAACGWAGRRSRWPWVATVQQSGPFGDVQRTDRSRAAKWLRQLALRADQFVGLSEHAAGELRNWGCPDEDRKSVV